MCVSVKVLQKFGYKLIIFLGFLKTLFCKDSFSQVFHEKIGIKVVRTRVSLSVVSNKLKLFCFSVRCDDGAQRLSFNSIIPVSFFSTAAEEKRVSSEDLTDSSAAAADCSFF